MKKIKDFFTKDVEGVGTFSFRYPSVKDIIEIERLRAEKYLHGIRYAYDEENKIDVPLGISNSAVYMASAFCALLVLEEKTPEGFSIDDCDDVELILDLYEEHYKWRLSFRKGNDTSKDPTEGANTA